MRTTQVLSCIVRNIGRLSEWTGWIVGALIFVLALALDEAVISRYIFNTSRDHMLELSVFIMLAMFVVGGAYAMRHEQHVRLDIFYQRLSPRKKSIVNLATCWILFFFIGSIFWFGIEKAVYSFNVWETSTSAWGPPIFPVRVLIPLGAFLLLLELVAWTIRDLYTIIKGRDLE
jgi:TRAP-type mannitol/chloroaromatic compound transport system permease small subunit